MTEQQTRIEVIDGTPWTIVQGMSWYEHANYFSVTTYPDGKRQTKIFGKRNYPDFEARYKAAYECAKVREARRVGEKRLHTRIAPTKKSGLPVGITLMRVKRVKQGNTYDSFLVQVGNHRPGKDKKTITGMRKCVGIGIEGEYGEAHKAIKLEEAKAHRARMVIEYEKKFPPGEN